MDEAEPDGWSAVAVEWGRLWGRAARPAWDAVLQVVGPREGARVLDVGCGSGDLLAHVGALGLSTAGIDPAPGMVEEARRRAPGGDVRRGVADDLPWPDATFDLVTAVNALHLADDPDEALAEAVRVTVPGGHVAVVGWAEAAHNDLDAIEAAVGRALDDEPAPDDPLQLPGGLESWLTRGGLAPVAHGLVEVPWTAPDDESLVRGVLLGEDDATMAELAPTVVAAARAHRVAGGGYRLVNHFRYAVGRRDERTG